MTWKAQLVAHLVTIQNLPTLVVECLDKPNSPVKRSGEGSKRSGEGYKRPTGTRSSIRHIRIWNSQATPIALTSLHMTRRPQMTNPHTGEGVTTQLPTCSRSFETNCLNSVRFLTRLAHEEVCDAIVHQVTAGPARPTECMFCNEMHRI